MKDLTKGKPHSLIFRFAIPLMLGSIFQQLYNVVDSVVVGNYLGEGALSAVGASFPIIFALFSLVIGIAQGVTIIISQNFGAGNIQKVKQAIFTMYVIVVISSILLSSLGIATSRLIFEIIDLPEHIIPRAVVYLDIIMGGIIISFGMSATNSILRGLGDSKTPLYFVIMSSLLNIAVDLLFVVVFKWGIAGVAYATILAQLVSLIIAGVYLFKHHVLLQTDKHHFKFNMSIFLQSIKIGLPVGLQQFFVAVGMIAIYQIVNQYDTIIIDAYSAAGRIEAFGVMPSISFSVALSVFVGQNIGAKKFERVKKGLISTIGMTSAISIFFTIITLFFGKLIMRMFSPNTEIIEVGYEYLLIVSAFYITFSLMFSLTGVFRGAGDTIIPMFITLFALWLGRIPISWYLSSKIGYTGIWWGIPLAWVIGLLLSTIYYFSNKWRKDIVVTRE